MINRTEIQTEPTQNRTIEPNRVTIAVHSRNTQKLQYFPELF